MDVVAFDTTELPPWQRLEAFRQVYERVVMPCASMMVHSEGPFWGRIARATFGETTVFEVADSPVTSLVGGAEAIRNEPGLMVDMLLEGRYVLDHGGSTDTVHAGGAVLWHSQTESTAVSPVDTTSRAFFIPEADLRDVANDLSQLSSEPVPADMLEVSLLRVLLGSLDLKANHPQDLSSLVGGHIRDLGLSMVARMLRKDDPSEGRGIKAARIRSIHTLVQRHYCSPTLSVTRVARQLGVSERYVQKLLDETGTSFGKLLMETRLDAAHRTLETATPGQSISTVAEACGFSDASHFTRAFRQRFGMTPSTVRDRA